MKFSDFVSVEAIRPSVSADSKEGVIREMTQSLVDAEKIATSEMDSIVKAIMKREDLGSTGIGAWGGSPAHKTPKCKADLLGQLQSANVVLILRVLMENPCNSFPPCFASRPARRSLESFRKHLSSIT